MEKKSCLTVLITQFIISGVVTDSELRYVREGYNVTFTCTTTSSEPHMNWEYLPAGGNSVTVAINEKVYGSFKDRSSASIPTEGTYRLTLFFFKSRTDSGKYRCFTNNLAIDNYVDITLAEGPSTASVNGISPVFADGTHYLTLTCTHDTATPSAIYQWWRNGVDITGDSTSILTLSPVQASDDGANITCTAMNSVYNDIRASHSVILTVYYACKMDIWVSAANPSEGDPVTFVCTCDSNPAATFTIKRPTGEITDRSRLDIVDIVRKDTGEYVCSAGNEHGKQEKTIAILVNYAPEVKVTFPVTANEGERGVQILREADGIPNSYNFGKWRQLGPTDYVEIKNLHGTHSGNQSLLTFDKPLTFEDNGFYECKVNNGVLDRRHMLDQSIKKYLQVMGSPKMLEKDDTTYGNIGQMIKVEVSFYSVPEFTIATWFALSDSGQQQVVDVSLTVQHTVGQRTLDTTFHGVSLKVNGYVATLLFNNMTVDNIGTYVVVITNDKGQASYAKKLEIKQTIVTTKDDINSHTIGVVAGSAAGISIVIVIVVTVVVVLCKRGVIAKPKCECLKGNGSTSKNVYQNQAFTLETAAKSYVDETVYQEIGPSVNPNMHYETMTAENYINQ